MLLFNLNDTPENGSPLYPNCSLGTLSASTFALYAQEGIAFTKGLFDVDEPEVWISTDAVRVQVDLKRLKANA